MCVESLFPVARFGAVQSVKAVKAGLSAEAVYRVRTEAGEYYLRLNPAGKPGFARMVTAQRLAAEQDIAPDVTLVDERCSAIISPRLEGAPFAMALARAGNRARALQTLSESLARLHAIPAPDLPLFDLSIGQALWDAQSRRRGFPTWAMPLGAFIRAGNAALAKDDRSVFSHNDVTPANLLWDGTKVWLVDWESAARMHPYFDLATFATFAVLTDNETTALLVAQERAPLTDEQLQTFCLLRNLARAWYGALLFSLIPDLTVINFKSRDETPTLRECYALLATGECDMRTSVGQALLGAAVLRQVPV